MTVTANPVDARVHLTLILGADAEQLPFAPLAELVARHGSISSMPDRLRRAFYRLRAAGGVPLTWAEQYADHFRIHPYDVWGWAYYELVLATPIPEEYQEATR